MSGEGGVGATDHVWVVVRAVPSVRVCEGGCVSVRVCVWGCVCE